MRTPSLRFWGNVRRRITSPVPYAAIFTAKALMRKGDAGMGMRQRAKGNGRRNGARCV